MINDPRDMQNALREEARTYCLAVQGFSEEQLLTIFMAGLSESIDLMKFLAGSEVRL